MADLPGGATEAWRVGFQPLGPPRSQTFWTPLTRLDHPERLWELRKLESNLPRVGEGQVSQIEIGVGELFEMAGNFLRFLLVFFRPRAKVRRTMERLSSRLFAPGRRPQRPQGF
jgi:hypothetical protein